METEITINQKIINTLLLNASFIDNPGLMHGKMGISIYFYHLARQTQNKIYEDYAGELIDEIYEEITLNTPAGFENGLAGIGWGIEYLVQNGFIEADTDEVLEEFDNRIFKDLIYNTPKEIGLLNGLIGLGAYFLKRLQNPASNDEKISALTNKQALVHLIDELDRKTQNITEITSEPLIFSNDRLRKESYGQTFESSNNPQTFELSNNRQTLELPNYKQQIGAQRKSRSSGTTNHKTFDLTWDYPVLLWFLAGLYEQNIFNFKVEKIIQRLIKPLSNKLNLPKLQSNRLLLALALTKLQQTTNSVRPGIHEHSEMNPAGRTNPESAANRDHKPQTAIKQSSNSQTTVKQKSNLQTIIEHSNFQTLITTLLSEINRNTINSELPQNNDTIRYGISGIAWVYQQIHRQAGGSHFKEEMEYWLNSFFVTDNNDEDILNMDFENLKAFGLLEGIAGILLNFEMTGKLNYMTI
jgi:hypothetical protein